MDLEKRIGDIAYDTPGDPGEAHFGDQKYVAYLAIAFVVDSSSALLLIPAVGREFGGCFHACSPSHAVVSTWNTLPFFSHLYSST